MYNPLNSFYSLISTMLALPIYRLTLQFCLAIWASCIEKHFVCNDIHAIPMVARLSQLAIVQCTQQIGVSVRMLSIVCSIKMGAPATIISETGGRTIVRPHETNKQRDHCFVSMLSKKVICLVISSYFTQCRVECEY